MGTSADPYRPMSPAGHPPMQSRTAVQRRAAPEPARHRVQDRRGLLWSSAAAVGVATC